MLDDSVVVELARVPVRRGRYDCVGGMYRYVLR
jgi:hypothetical protein